MVWSCSCVVGIYIMYCQGVAVNIICNSSFNIMCWHCACNSFYVGSITRNCRRCNRIFSTECYCFCMDRSSSCVVGIYVMYCQVVDVDCKVCIDGVVCYNICECVGVVFCSSRTIINNNVSQSVTFVRSKFECLRSVVRNRNLTAWRYRTTCACSCCNNVWLSSNKCCCNSMACCYIGECVVKCSENSTFCYLFVGIVNEYARDDVTFISCNCEGCVCTSTNRNLSFRTDASAVSSSSRDDNFRFECSNDSVVCMDVFKCVGVINNLRQLVNAIYHEA